MAVGDIIECARKELSSFQDSEFLSIDQLRQLEQSLCAAFEVSCIEELGEGGILRIYDRVRQQGGEQQLHPQYRIAQDVHTKWQSSNSAANTGISELNLQWACAVHIPTLPHRPTVTKCGSNTASELPVFYEALLCPQKGEGLVQQKDQAIDAFSALCSAPVMVDAAEAVGWSEKYWRVGHPMFALVSAV